MPEWGARRLDLAAVSHGRTAGRGGTGWVGAGEIAVGAMLVVLWTMLWAFFISGVVEPAARLRNAATHPSVDVATALPPARSADGPRPVDTAGGAL